MKVKSASEVAQLYPTISDPMDCSPAGSYTHGIFQARLLEWGAIAFSGNWHKRFFFSNDFISVVFLLYSVLYLELLPPSNPY